MPLHLKARWNSYTEPWLPLSYAYWYLIQNLSSGLRGMRSRAFATWYSALGHHFAGFEAAWTPVPRLVGMATGRVLELGPGSGNQLPRFNCTDTTYIYSIEPNKQLFNLLRDEIVQQHGLGEIYVPINAALEDDKVLDSWGIETGSIDTVVCMQVLCSVSDVPRAAKQIHRLLKPGGQLLFWEHQASNDTVTRLVQSERTRNPLNFLECKLTDYRMLERDMGPVIGGCHLSRDIEQALAEAGNWEIAELGHDDNQPWHLMLRVWGRFIKL